jgi:hypothetical protein
MGVRVLVALAALEAVALVALAGPVAQTEQ